jgi:hypothetical protein
MNDIAGRPLIEVINSAGVNTRLPGLAVGICYIILTPQKRAVNNMSRNYYKIVWELQQLLELTVKFDPLLLNFIKSNIFVKKYIFETT